MSVRHVILRHCGLFLFFGIITSINGQVESAGSFVTAGNDSGAGTYRMLAAGEAAPGAGTLGQAGPYAERSGAVAIVNNPPIIAEGELALRGKPVVVNIVAADLFTLTGARDVDGDPIVFLVTSETGTMHQQGVIKTEARLTAATNAVWIPPVPVLGADVLLRVGVDDGMSVGDREVRFRAQYAPFIRVQSRTPLLVSAAGALGITMTTDGTGPLAHQWLKDGQPLLGHTNATLLKSPAQRLDSGTYELSLVSPYGGAFSSHVVVKVVVPQAMLPPVALPTGGFRIRFGDFDDSLLSPGSESEFQVEWSADLSTWNVLSDAGLSVVAGRVEFTDTESAPEGRRFYRIISR